MTQHADILDTRESLRGSFAAAVALHGTVVGLLVLYGWLSGRIDTFGGDNPALGAVAVESVDKIPLPHQGMTNPVASDSQSQVPQTEPTPKEKREVVQPEPDAVKLHNSKAKQKPEQKASVRHMYKSYKELQPNQLTSTLPQQVSTPDYSAKPGSGRVGTGPNTTLGTRCAGYASQIQSIVARNWHTSDVEARIQSAPPVISRFDLMGDGTIRNVTILQASGIQTLDASVQRAILDSNPLPRIPPECNKDSAKVEFTFELKR